MRKFDALHAEAWSQRLLLKDPVATRVSNILDAAGAVADESMESGNDWRDRDGAAMFQLEFVLDTLEDDEVLRWFGERGIGAGPRHA